MAIGVDRRVEFVFARQDDNRATGGAGDDLGFLFADDVDVAAAGDVMADHRHGRARIAGFGCDRD